AALLDGGWRARGRRLCSLHPANERRARRDRADRRPSRRARGGSRGSQQHAGHVGRRGGGQRAARPRRGEGAAKTLRHDPGGLERGPTGPERAWSVLVEEAEIHDTLPIDPDARLTEIGPRRATVDDDTPPLPVAESEGDRIVGRLPTREKQAGSADPVFLPSQ